MNLFRAKKRKYEMIGVEFATEGVAFAHIERVVGQLPRLLSAEFLPCEPEEAPARLRERLGKLNLRGLPATAVLASTGYQLLLGDAPKVPAEELNEALRWRVKDLVSFPVADAVIDAFLLPDSCSRGDARLAYVTVARREAVASLVAAMEETSLSLAAIEIPELALARLVEVGYDTARPVALVNLYQGGGSLLMVKAGELYLARNFKLDYNAGLLDDIPVDALTLELQRSLDYFERQLRQPPAARILLCGENVSADKLTESLTSALPGRMDLLDWSAALTSEEPVAEHHQALCLRALGAALREEAVR
ncbi:MSHA biogenesis protein MshI [Gilvimarinus sp. SDUM040014]|uniref:MSHA biogenesis protein MshI n=1 Tax=Gilvimarinus algae TaxID=3058037 RepID=A0ABT8TK29_9GAMM|nr:MSHA biogenesis protein MshI [Gilvimarinus sp. SDUM040014]MDO3382991.1 MSHA biogenesis protein MshI [Gilvimarinus sp. SDUM040014]